MSGLNESHLVAVVLPAPAAADAVRRVWDAGDAVIVIDPSAPGLNDRITAAAATHIIDSNGTRPTPDGRPVPDGVGAVVATSGTTGRARHVELTMAGLAASATAVHAALAVDPQCDLWLACLPLYSIAGLAIVARSYTTGTPIEVHPRFDAREVAEASATCSLVSLVPTTLGRLVDADVSGARRFRHILIGGAPIPEALTRRAAHAGVNLVTTYGLTETGGGCVHDGHALAGVEIELARDTSEILVRGPVVMRGYRDAPADRETWHDGWLRTGDVGRWEPDGRLAVVDRIKDLIITGGVNVSPVMVEIALRDAPGVGDLAIIGTPDPEWGERIVACIVPHDPSDLPSLAALRAAGTANGLRPAELPREIRLVASIPRTPGGKTLRRILRDEPAASPKPGRSPA